MFLEGTFLFPDIHIKLTDWQWCCVHLCLYNQSCTSFCNKKNMCVQKNGNKIRQLQIKETRFILPYLIEFIKSSNFYLLLCYSFRFVVPVHAYEALAKTQYFLPCCVHFHCNSVHICYLCKCISKNVPVVHLFKHILS